MLTKENCNGILLMLLLFSNFILFVSADIYDKISSFLFIAFFLLIFLGLLINADKIFKDKVNLICFFGLFLFSVLSLVFTDGGIGSVINLFSSIGGVLLFGECNIDKTMKKFIIILCIILYFILFYMSFNTWSIYVSGSYDVNPNSIGIASFLCYSLICLCYFNSKNKFKKIFFALFSGITLYSIYLTNCRSALLGILFFILSYFFPFVRKILKKNKSKIFLLVTIVGIIFPIIYISMYKNGVDFIIPIINKRLYSGREQLWMYMIDSMKQAKYGMVLGVGTNNVTGLGVISNIHSWYLSIFYSFGFFPFFLYFILFINIIKKYNDDKLLFILLIIFLIGFVETAAMGNVCKIFIFAILSLENINSNRKNDLE